MITLVILLSLLIWRAILLVFQRVSNRYPKRNAWKKDEYTSIIGRD